MIIVDHMIDIKFSLVTVTWCLVRAPPEWVTATRYRLNDLSKVLWNPEFEYIHFLTLPFLSSDQSHIPRICLTIEHKASISRSDSCTHYPMDRLSTFWTTGAWSKSLAELFTWQFLFFLSPGWGLCWKTKYGPVRLTIWFFYIFFFFSLLSQISCHRESLYWFLLSPSCYQK